MGRQPEFEGDTCRCQSKLECKAAFLEVSLDLRL